MKVCSLCQREFDDQQQFCTRDGTKLTRIQERGYCRRCGKDYPVTLTKCPLHGTPLAEHGPRTILGDNFCHLCDSDFPKAFKLCPVHGIALQTSPLKKKLRKIESDEPAVASNDSNGSHILEAQPPSTNPLPHLGAPKPEQVWATGDLPKTDALFHPKEAIPIVAKPVVGATRELDRSAIADKPETEIAPPRTDQITVSPVSKPNATPRRNPFAALNILNRRRVVSLVAVLLALMVTVGAYNAYVKRAAEESIRFSGEQNKSANNVAKKVDPKPDNNNVDLSKTVNKPAPTAEPVAAATTVGAVTTVQKNTAPVVTPPPTRGQSKQTVKPEAPEQDETAPSDKTRPIFIPKAQDPPADPPRKEDSKSTANTKDKKSDTFEQITPARPDTARVVASVRNRRRVAVPGGFHYSFEVVLTEVNGIGVSWENGVIERTSETGFTTSKTAGYDFALAAHGHTQVRIDVDMLGSTTRDWRGTVVYSNKGLDDNGHVVRVKYRIPLDEHFPD